METTGDKGQQEKKDETRGTKPKQDTTRRATEAHPVMEPVVEAVTTEAPVPVEPEQLIYTGPNIGRGRLRQYTVFRAGVPAYLAPLLEEQPAIRRLLVPIAELSATQKNIEVKGTIEHKAYQTLKGVID